MGLRVFTLSMSTLSTQCAAVRTLTRCVTGLMYATPEHSLFCRSVDSIDICIQMMQRKIYLNLFATLIFFGYSQWIRTSSSHPLGPPFRYIELPQISEGNVTNENEIRSLKPSKNPIFYFGH